MKKAIVPLLAAFIAIACRQNDKTHNLEARVDSLQQKLAMSYSPGFGEFMSAIQVHHAKLWFAGTAQNWELAGFEMKEIQENMDALQKYVTDRPETKSLPELKPSLDSLQLAIEKKDVTGFKRSYSLLTTACNTCHQAVHFSYNRIKIPDSPPFTNQDFEKQ